MKLSNRCPINADAATVWAGLLDPEVLKACVPGCTEMSGSAQEGFEATVIQKVGPVKATFKGSVALSQMVEPHSLTISGEGKGGAAGFAKGSADVRLELDGDITILHYDVEAKVGGKLAQLGSRIIDGFAKKMAETAGNIGTWCVCPPSLIPPCDSYLVICKARLTATPRCIEFIIISS